MQDSAKQFLQQLLDTPGPSGYEQNVQKVGRDYVKTFCDDIRTDVHNNVVATLRGVENFSVMLAGHADEIGMVVLNVDDNGYLYFNRIGGVDPTILPSQRVRVLTKNGRVRGVIGKKPAHLLDEEDKKPPKIHELWIDIGAKDKADALGQVRVGDDGTVSVSGPGGQVSVGGSLAACSGQSVVINSSGGICINGQLLLGPSSPAAVEQCGSVTSLNGHVTSPGAQQAEDCFFQAYQQCTPATLTATLNGVDAGTTHMFSLQPTGGTCLITDVAQTHVYPGPRLGPPVTVTCASLAQTASGLLFAGCGSLGDLLVPAPSAVWTKGIVANFGLLMQNAALELGRHGIRANSIGPGLVQTPLSARLWQTPAVRDAFIAETPLGRYCQPEEVAELALYLASDTSSFMTGQTLYLDGGQSLKKYPEMFGFAQQLAAEQ